ncbi:protein kinase domain-containing protein [Paenibacillus pinistramenti]|uniref:protein kinase domain-containing protein n=1 Tax=Paenibacillus pinistramenti TaxID=1768003 RepID=UPI001107CDF2|nr:protein kinase [Paenibacillus pinistramenti]
MKTMWRKYTVDLDIIGNGSYCKVYKAYNPEGKKLAIKVMPDIEVAEREAKIMNRYESSPYLPRYYDFFILNKKAHLVTEYVKGKSMGGTFQNTVLPKMDEPVSIAITINVLKGIEKLHKIGYIHDDVKPKNIMLYKNDPEQLKVIDFNIAKKITGNKEMHKELQDVCKLCALLLNGSLEDIRSTEFENERLGAVLLNPFSPDEEERYTSARQLIHQLESFL